MEKMLFFARRARKKKRAVFPHVVLSIFEAVDGLIKERVKAHPPVITVYLPEDATAEHEAAAIDKARKDSPGIQVVARRYRRPVSRKRKNPANNADISQ